MSNYLDNGREILRILIENGYESFLIGPYVRDYASTKNSHETLEIITPAVYETWVELFGASNIRRMNVRQSLLTFEENRYIISTYRQESKFVTGSINDSNGLINAARISDNTERFAYELSQRTFTVDALCIDVNGRLIDYNNYYDDVGKKCIRFIQDPIKAYAESPKLYLDTAQLMSVLGFSPDKETFKAAKTSAKACQNLLNLTEISTSMKYILNGPYAIEATSFLVRSKAYKYLNYFGPELLRLYNNTAHPTFDEFVLRIFISHKAMNEEVLKVAEEPERIKLLFDEINNNPKSKFDLRTVCHYGLEDSLLCDNLTHLIYDTPLHTAHIKHLHRRLKLKKEDSLVTTEAELLNLINSINCQPKMPAHELYERIVEEAMMGHLKNDTKAVSNWALKCITDYAHEHAHEHANEHTNTVESNSLVNETDTVVETTQLTTDTEESPSSNTTLYTESDEEWIERTAQDILTELEQNGITITESVREEAYEQAKASVLETQREREGEDDHESTN